MQRYQKYTINRKEYLSSYEGEVPISIIHSSDGDICHGVSYSDIRNQIWYSDYEDKYVISFKIIKDEKANGDIVLLLIM